jgi:glycosyltransferase involved in cell wall biosynthesis
MISRVQRWKGQHHFLKALALLRDRGIECRGLLVGGDAYGLDPVYNGEIRSLRQELGLQQRLTWVDHVADPSEYLVALDVFVNVSVREGGVSLALIEAMAAGRCIVAVADGGSPEALQDNRSGILLARSDGGLLADALTRTLTEPNLRTRLGVAARAEYERRFTAESFARTLEDRLCLLCQPGHRRELKRVAREPR